MSLFENINLWAVLIAAIVKVILGSFWYSPLILGKSWMRENGYTEADFIKGHPIWLMALMSIFLAFVSALAMATFITPKWNMISGAGMGAIISIVWISASKANTTIYENYSLKHYLIHAGYDICSYTAMGAILGGWH
ncbi:MAG TPA: DUF1761 domain-containing protein [Prolixibacteraceae bacterium]|nr:DUF1761 domain-containing protein [Prolixibacteraceae bacterium]